MNDKKGTFGTVEFESVKVEELYGGRVVKVIAAGKLTRESYRLFIPELDNLVKKHRIIRLMFEMIEFDGWTLGAVWDDLKFGCKHFNHIERIAIVGDRKWEKAMATVCKPFTRAKVRYFDISEIDEAEKWIAEDIQGKDR